MSTKILLKKKEKKKKLSLIIVFCHTHHCISGGSVEPRTAARQHHRCKC